MRKSWCAAWRSATRTRPSPKARSAPTEPRRTSGSRSGSEAGSALLRACFSKAAPALSYLISHFLRRPAERSPEAARKGAEYIKVELRRCRALDQREDVVMHRRAACADREGGGRKIDGEEFRQYPLD